MLEWIRDRDHLRKAQREHEDFFVLAFWGSFSDAAQRALAELKQFSQEAKDVPLYVVDVQKVRGLHKEYGVASVPTVVAVEKGKVTKRIEGVESAAFYAVHLSGATPSRSHGDSQAAVRRVVVYSGPGCPACGRLKTYLRRHGVAFRDVDISRDARAARQIARRSGQMAVPQTDINGRLVVGFDRVKLDTLLGIQSERRN
ncbi:MAG: thioredoxin family protein [Planctomycetes bacterium]|nr:thioredoxin family protein [Planctomycetota bacterium]